MSKQTRVSHPLYNLLPTEIDGFDSLAELALDMRWSWNHATDEVWRQLDPALWEFRHNPWVVLQTVSRDQIERVLADPAFRKNVDGLQQAAETPAWFQQNHSQAPLTCAAYFSMEFMLSEALPIYSGMIRSLMPEGSVTPPKSYSSTIMPSASAMLIKHAAQVTSATAMMATVTTSAPSMSSLCAARPCVEKRPAQPSATHPAPPARDGSPPSWGRWWTRRPRRKRYEPQRANH